MYVPNQLPVSERDELLHTAQCQLCKAIARFFRSIKVDVAVYENSQIIKISTKIIRFIAVDRSRSGTIFQKLQNGDRSYEEGSPAGSLRFLEKILGNLADIFEAPRCRSVLNAFVLHRGF